MNRAGTEYFTIRTVTIEDLSTLGFSTKPGSKDSAGNGARNGCSAVHDAGEHTQAELVALFRVSRTTVYRELQRRSA
jgi:hypothetical protein